MLNPGIVSFRHVRPEGAVVGGRRTTRLGKGVVSVLLLFISMIIGADAQEGRWIAVEGASNFRDIGGYPAGGGRVKNGVLFRSDDLSRIDAAGMQDLKKLGIVTVVDLRVDPKRSSRIEELSDNTITVARLPMFADPLKDKNDYYKRMIVNSRESLIGLLVLLSGEENLPMVIFDEDGVNEVDVAAEFVLLALGVRGPDVISEYLLSNERGQTLKREWGEIIVRYFDEYGGMDYYVTGILGLSQDQIDRIRENLITQ